MFTLPVETTSPITQALPPLDPVDIVAYKLEMFRSGGIIRERQLILVIYQLEDFRLLSSLSIP